MSGTPTAREPMLVLRDVAVRYRGAPMATVAEIGLDLAPGERLALVGESGSGKTTLLNAVAGLLPRGAEVTGTLELNGRSLIGLHEADWRALHGTEIGYVPQDPHSNFNPLMTIGNHVVEAVRAHRTEPGRSRREVSLAGLRRAGVPDPDRVARAYPHEMSGGLRQRGLIASAVVTTPRLILADEPTSALDVTVQRQILDLLDELVSDSGAASILVTHDLGVAAERADWIAVMQHGRIVEAGPAEDVVTAPVHRYTTILLEAVPVLSDPLPVRSSARQEPLLQVQDVSRTFRSHGRTKRAVDGVTFEIPSGRSVALVGESGSGKSTIARMVLGLERPDQGRIRYRGSELARADRREVQAVFQDPGSTINPLFTVRQALEEPLHVHRIGTRAQRRERAVAAAERMGLEAERLDHRATELSGGQKQRVAIARALMLEPRLLVCDEPVSALDVLIQRQILDLLHQVRDDGVSLLFISHDLAVVREIADDVLVLKDGVVLEHGEPAHVFGDPQHSYTRALIAAIPQVPARRTV